ncbi:MAG: response regulator [Cyanobacteria bacterium P01_D01_bin.14]
MPASADSAKTVGLILVVDDLPANLDVLSETLVAAGYDIAIATSGARALKRLERITPDLILLDIKMAGMSGFEVCQQLKLNPKTAAIPIIFITALTDTDSKTRGFDLGAVDYVTKPFQTQEVLARIRTHLQLSRLTQDLEQQVTRKVASLEEARQAAEAANRAKSQFLANMSHELRTPLNAILGMAEALQDEVFGTVNERQLKAYQTIERSGSHLLELINDILDLSKIESEHGELCCGPTAVDSLCQSSLAFVAQAALKKNIALDLQQPSQLPDVVVDERRLRQVLINLLTNAVKFTPENGRITLQVSLGPATETADHRAMLRLAVSDTGIGIAPKDQAQLFQPFIQVDGDLNRLHAGTGLGLALIKRIVERHDGTVSVASEPDQGSCFTVEIPCETVGAATASTPPLPVILLTDDNSAAANSLSSYLHAKGYRLVSAKNTADILPLALAEHPHLCLIDLPMLADAQADILPALQQQLPQVPVVVLAEEGGCDLSSVADNYHCFSRALPLRQLVTQLQSLLAMPQVGS